ncbi:hypothetical protein TIFTF001_037835 [Ficus carica]|uniref:NB-ARC domain-containing protein n=1 Tax=Ficus carica TaxID=3494 RepID=A0AA88E6C6_FICCA|nr:hypothetical protein TIFTF001_037835 [Ficus carica]
MELAGPVIQLLQWMSAPISRCWKYHCGLKENVETLKQRMEKLNRRKEDIHSRLRTEIVEGETKLKAEVEFWLQSVEKIDAEINTINQQVEAVKCFSRAGMGKNVAQKIDEVEELYRSGEFPDGLILQLPRQIGEIQPTTTLGGETTFTRKMEEIWALLMDDEVRKIGVYGMGGMGKTTLMKQISNRLLERKEKFDSVIWVTASQASSIIKLQHDVASEIKFDDISMYEGETIRARKLYAELCKIKSYVLIIDDLWDVYRLDEVGIPDPSPQNGSKLVLTTRRLDVCNGMNCKAIPMARLSETESLDLFLDTVGRDVLSIQNMEVMVKLFVKECPCLPLAIVTIAGSLKGIVDYNNWKTALEDLKAYTKGTDEIFEKLKFSYDRLNDEKLQACLLSCALFPEDYAIKRYVLIDYLIAEEIVRGINRQAELERAQAMLNKLVHACLLEDTDCTRDCVKMHDLIRDMALKITSDNPRFLVEAGTGLKCVPDEENWKADLVKVSLMDNGISNIPWSFESPKCPLLSTLLLNGNYFLSSISNNFFLHMKGLSLLDLSETPIENLPESISELVSLTALLLRGCLFLTYVPSLAKLTALKRLDFGGSGIEEVPQGMENLNRLRYLEFKRCNQLELIPDGILCKLSNLQYLSLGREDCETKIRWEELVKLTKLEELYCMFNDLDSFHACVRSMADGGPTHYKLLFGSEAPFAYQERGKVVNLAKSDLRKSVAVDGDCPVLLPQDVEILCMQNCCIDVSSLCELITSFKNLTNLREFCMSECNGLKHLFVYSSSIIPLLQRLEEWDLEEVSDLRGLIRRENVASSRLPPVTFSSLKILRVVNCDKIKRLLIDTDLLPNLEDVSVIDCKQLVEIISAASDHGEEEEEEEEAAGGCDHGVISTVTLPKLLMLFLWSLPKLKSIPVVADRSLRDVWIKECPKLKRVPCLDRDPCPPSLQCVEIDDNLWESLEWNHPNAKDAVESLRQR